jgi:hypothetical protein
MLTCSCRQRQGYSHISSILGNLGTGQAHCETNVGTLQCRSLENDIALEKQTCERKCTGITRERTSLVPSPVIAITCRSGKIFMSYCFNSRSQVVLSAYRFDWFKPCAKVSLSSGELLAKTRKCGQILSNAVWSNSGAPSSRGR